METQESEAGGFSLVSFMVKGEGVYSKLKFESGSHRVQRVPKTETQGLSLIHILRMEVVLIIIDMLLGKDLEDRKEIAGNHVSMFQI